MKLNKLFILLLGLHVHLSLSPEFKSDVSVYMVSSNNESEEIKGQTVEKPDQVSLREILKNSSEMTLGTYINPTIDEALFAELNKWLARSGRTIFNPQTGQHHRLWASEFVYADVNKYGFKTFAFSEEKISFDGECLGMSCFLASSTDCYVEVTLPDLPVILRIEHTSPSLRQTLYRLNKQPHYISELQALFHGITITDITVAWNTLAPTPPFVSWNSKDCHRIVPPHIEAICKVLYTEYQKMQLNRTPEGFRFLYQDASMRPQFNRLEGTIASVINDELATKTLIVCDAAGHELASFEAKFKLIQNLLSSPVVSPVNNEELYNLILQQVPADIEPIKNPDGSWSVAQPKRFKLTRNDISSNEVRLTMLTNEPKYLGFMFIKNGDELLFPEANFTIKAPNISQLMGGNGTRGYTYRSDSNDYIPSIPFQIYFDIYSLSIAAHELNGSMDVHTAIHGISHVMHARYLFLREIGQEHNRDPLSEADMAHLKATLLEKIVKR